MIDRNALVKDLLKTYTAEELSAGSSDPELCIGYIEHYRLVRARSLQDFYDLTDEGWGD
jgi:hypothetical protein